MPETSDKEHEYSVGRWAWKFVPQMVSLGAVIGAVGGAAIALFLFGFEQYWAFPVLSVTGATVLGAAFGFFAERVSRDDRHWKAGENK